MRGEVPRWSHVKHLVVEGFGRDAYDMRAAKVEAVPEAVRLLRTCQVVLLWWHGSCTRVHGGYTMVRGGHTGQHLA